MNRKRNIIITIVIAGLLLVGGISVARSNNIVQNKKLTMTEMGLREASKQELQAPILNGLTEHTARMKIAIGEKFGIKNYSLYREGDPEDHGRGRAVDYMVYNNEKLGDDLVEFLVEHIDDLDIDYIIWKQRLYASRRHKYGVANTWGAMEDRGSITANHYDHVHVSFKK